jgi:hypothetical protein
VPTVIYCERKGTISKAQADPRSFRWLESGKAKVLIACPKGSWNDRAQRCATGIAAYKILTKPKNGRCKMGARKVKKRS